MRNLVNYLVATLLLSGCNPSELDVAGIYVKSPSVHTVDSLFVFADTIVSDNSYNKQEYLYEQHFYNKKTGQLLFKNKNSWWIERDGDIAFRDFYWDNDRDHSEFNYSTEIMKDKVILFSTKMDGDQIMVDGQSSYLPVD